MVAYRLYENRKNSKKQKIDKKADFFKNLLFLYIKIRFPSFSNKLQEIQLSEYQIHHLLYLGSAFRKLQSKGLYTKTEHRTVKYLNNLIEQDHRPIKRRNKFYRSLRTASTTIKGMETIRGIYKKNRRNGTLFGFSVSTEIKVLMGIPA